MWHTKENDDSPMRTKMNCFRVSIALGVITVALSAPHTASAVARFSYMSKCLPPNELAEEPIN